MKNRNGFLLVNKPCGMSSFDVIRKMRRIFSCQKIGHAGTLDPLAEGLLIVAFGYATRLIQFLLTEPKVYQFELQFGTETDTLDTSGKILRSGENIPSEKALHTILHEFRGNLSQVPPIYSAIKIGGKRAYSLARKGLTPDMEPRNVTIDAFTLLNYDQKMGRAFFEVTCSGGTYVRSLARDVAYRLGSVGYTNSIFRIACGNFTIAAATTLDSINSETDLIPVREALALPTLQADDTMVKTIICGRNILLPQFKTTAHEYALVFSGEQFVALLHKLADNYYHPDIVAAVPEGKV